jgi:hypothetical protein
MRRGKARRFILTGIIALGFIFAGSIAFSESQEQSEKQQTIENRWEQEAEQTFGLGHGLGRLLMTNEEWQEHHRKMQQMTMEERNQYRQEIHSKMSERAQELGIVFPDKPRQPCDKPLGGRGGRGGMGSGARGGKR